MDAEQLLAVNEAHLAGLAPGADQVIVVAATWGRGCDPALLQALEPYRRASGYNGTLVALVPESRARELLGARVPPAGEGTPVVALAYGQAYSELRPVL